MIAARRTAIRTLVGALVCFASLGSAAAEPYRAGYLSATAPGDPLVPVSVWYPTLAAAASFEAGPYTISAVPNAPPAPGRHRLVIVSHGSGGSDLGHHDLAEYLARNGIVVAAPRHLGDSFDQPRDAGGKQLVSRPWQVVATLDAVLSESRLAGAVDPARVGMAGFSAGAYTTLVIAGAGPRFELWPVHCAEHPEDHELCSVAPPGGGARGELPRETRIKAAVVMAPIGVVFDAAGLAGIGIPLRLYQAADDRVLVNAWNAERVLGLLPRPPEHVTVPGGHYVFLAPCSPALAARVPELCLDPPGVDRIGIHARINAEILDFFDRSLGPD
jgi:predicted dienelactone hydrolase